MIHRIQSKAAVMRLFAGLVLLVAAVSAHAQRTCSFGSGSGWTSTQTRTESINTSLGTVGRDYPIGFAMPGPSFAYNNFLVTCNGANGVPANVSFEVTSSQGLMSPQPTMFDPSAQGKLYNTGVPNLGVYVWIGSYSGGGSVTGLAAPGTTQYNFPNGSNSISWPLSIHYNFVRTGALATGTPITISGASLPKIKFSIGGLTLLNLGLTGSQQILPFTCTASAAAVNLGDWSASTFTGVNTGSPWRNAEITLKNCPALPGQQQITLNIAPSGTSTTNGPLTNAISYRLTPTAAQIAQPGILNLSAPTQGNNAARGVGIEIRERNAAAPIAFNSGISAFSGTTSSVSNLSIPLMARYTQISSPVVPGQANGSVEFLISYQ